MKNITCIAIDDEPFALTVIKSFCERKGGISLTVYDEPRVGFEAIKHEQPDLVLLDIEMNSVSGLEIARQLPEKTVLVFTTAHAQFALEGFNLDAVDFLHKPFAYDRFEVAINKAFRRIALKNAAQAKESITVKQEYNNVIIPLDDILYVGAMENYTKIYRRNKGYVLSRMSLKSILEMLPEQQFFRIHKSYIVPAHNVAGYASHRVNLYAPAIELPIGRTYLPAFMEWIGK